MNKEILIREIDQLLAKDKVKFLNNLKADIYNVSVRNLGHTKFGG